MRLLKEFHYHPRLKLAGKSVTRQAVRGIIRSDNRLLMIHSPVNGDYKFPGGGMEAGETKEQALIREIREETGILSTKIIAEFGEIHEFDKAIDEGYEYFKMISSYFACEIGDETAEQKLDEYEEKLGFTPVWIEIESALKTNRYLIENTQTPRWTPRDTFVLELLSTEISSCHNPPC